MSIFPCLVGPNIAVSSIRQIIDAGLEVADVAEELMVLSQSTETRILDFFIMVESMRVALAEVDSKMNINTFKTLFQVLNKEKMSDSLSLIHEVDDLSSRCLNQSSALSKAATRGASLLPDSYKDENSICSLVETQKDLENLENAVLQLRNLIDLVNQMNIFHACTTGTDALDALLNKKNLILMTFQRICSLNESISEWSNILAPDNCCGQLKLSIACVKVVNDMNNASAIIQKLTLEGGKLFGVMKDLIVATWEKIESFPAEFDAGKKIKKIVNYTSTNVPVDKLLDAGGDLVGNIASNRPGLFKNPIQSFRGFLMG
jgi:hypothetical protein